MILWDLQHLLDVWHKIQHVEAEAHHDGAQPVGGKEQFSVCTGDIDILLPSSFSFWRMRDQQVRSLTEDHVRTYGLFRIDQILDRTRVIASWIYALVDELV